MAEEIKAKIASLEEKRKDLSPSSMLYITLSGAINELNKMLPSVKPAVKLHVAEGAVCEACE